MLAESAEVDHGGFGESVALSADGNTAVIGDRNDGRCEPLGCEGAAWVFTRSGTNWTQQGPKLIGKREGRDTEFGCSVALSADGDTALIGGEGDKEERGAAWVLIGSLEEATWTFVQ